MQKISNRSGFTLVEAIVTVFIITVALWGTVTGFLKINSWVEDIENIAVVDKYIAGKMEEIRGEDFDNILAYQADVTDALIGGEPISVSIEISNEPDGSLPPVSIQVEGEGESITIGEEEDIKEVKISAHWTSHASPKKGITRAITFYVYKKGINRRP